MLSATNKVLILILCSSLVGCLDSKDKNSTSSEPSSESNPVVMGSVSNDKSCNPGKQGAIIFDQTQSQFYFCNNSEWVAVDLRGAKGDKGDKGDAGSGGSNGTIGPVGPQGTAGANGRDGLDGNGIKLSLKENGQVKGIFMQFLNAVNTQEPLATMMLPVGDIILINIATGVYEKTPNEVYYTTTDCTGTAYINAKAYEGPHVVGRIYVSKDQNENTIGFFRGEEFNNLVVPRSYRLLSPRDSVNACINNSGAGPMMGLRIAEVPAIPSLHHLAPIRFSP